MSSLAHRAEKFNKLYKVARKHYQPILPPANRSVLEHLVYACCLEDSSYVAADEVFAKLLENYFDWNEIRVTTSLELSELMKGLHDPVAAANRLRKALHGLFESRYSFDADFLKKENLGKAIEQLEKFKGVSPFGVASVAQLALGGHSIPVDKALLTLLHTIAAITDEEFQQAKVPGLERTIPKNKGAEFSSLVHQLAAEFLANPHDKRIRDIVLQIDSAATDRFPKRGGGRKKAEPAASPPPAIPAKGPEKPISKTLAGDKQKKTPAAPPPKPPTRGDQKPLKGKPPERKPPERKMPERRPADRKPAAAAKPVEKKKSATKTLAKKKPR